MVHLGFKWAVPTFAGAGGAHIDTPCYESISYELTRDSVLACEKLGFDAVWVADHLILGRNNRIFECWTLLSALAAITSTIRLGTLGLCDAYRNPALVAKMAATLDVVSRGRLEYGVKGIMTEGADPSYEHLTYGFQWDNDDVRAERVTEGIQVAKRMWTEEKPSFDGKHYRIRGAVCEPKPIQKPHPPIWVEGGEERHTLRLVAEHADGWDWIGSIEDVKRRVSILEKRCDEVGRNPKDVARQWDGHVLIAQDEVGLKALMGHVNSLSPNYPSYGFVDPSTARKIGIPTRLNWERFKNLNLIGTPDEIAERVQLYADAGITHFMLWFIDYPSLESMKLFAEEVIPRFR